jgi:hypothetical protein
MKSETTQAFSGCKRCGYVGRTYGYRDGVLARRSCPRCDGPLQEVGVVQARSLVRERQRERGFREKVKSQLAELARDGAYEAGTGSSPVDSSGPSPVDSRWPRG